MTSKPPTILERLIAVEESFASHISLPHAITDVRQILHEIKSLYERTSKMADQIDTVVADVTAFVNQAATDMGTLLGYVTELSQQIKSIQFVTDPRLQQLDALVNQQTQTLQQNMAAAAAQFAAIQASSSASASSASSASSSTVTDGGSASSTTGGGASDGSGSDSSAASNTDNSSAPSTDPSQSDSPPSGN